VKTDLLSDARHVAVSDTCSVSAGRVAVREVRDSRSAIGVYDADDLDGTALAFVQHREWDIAAGSVSPAGEQLLIAASRAGEDFLTVFRVELNAATVWIPLGTTRYLSAVWGSEAVVDLVLHDGADRPELNRVVRCANGLVETLFSSTRLAELIDGHIDGMVIVKVIGAKPEVLLIDPTDRTVAGTVQGGARSFAGFDNAVYRLSDGTLTEHRIGNDGFSEARRWTIDRSFRALRATASNLLAIGMDGSATPLPLGDVATLNTDAHHYMPEGQERNFSFVSNRHTDEVATAARSPWTHPYSSVTLRTWENGAVRSLRRSRATRPSLTTETIRDVGPPGSVVRIVRTGEHGQEQESENTVVALGHPGQLMRSDGFWLDGRQVLDQFAGTAIFVDVPPPYQVHQLVLPEILRSLPVLKHRPVLVGLSADAFLVASAHAVLGTEIGGCLLRSPVLDPEGVDQHPAAQYWTASIATARNSNHFVAPSSLLAPDRPVSPLLVQQGLNDGRVTDLDGTAYATSCSAVCNGHVTSESYAHGHGSLLPIAATRRATIAGWAFVASMWVGATAS